MAEGGPPAKKKRSPCWTLPVPGDEIAKKELMEKMKNVKDMLKNQMGRATNYYEILDIALDSCADNVKKAKSNDSNFSSYLKANLDVNDPTYIWT